MMSFLVGLVATAGLGTLQDEPPNQKGPLPPDGLKALKHPDASVRYQAAILLANLGPTAKFAVADLRETLKDANGYVRVKAAEALWKIEKTPATVLLPVLLEALKDKDAQLRAAAAPVIGMLGSKAKTAVPALIQALKDKDERVRGEAVSALGEIGPPAKEAAPALLSLVQDDFSFVEPLVVSALGNMGPGVVPALLKGLDDASVARRRAAAEALTLLGPQAREALPGLLRALADKDASVRSQSARALGSLGDEAGTAVARLKECLQDRDTAVRVSVALALWQITAKADHLDVLTAALADALRYVRIDALQALGAIGPAAKDTSGAVRPLLADKESQVRQAAAQALGKIGPASNSGKDLEMLFKDEEPLVRLSAGLAHWRVTGKAERTLEVFRLGLKDEDRFVRRQTLALLAEMGLSAQPLFDTLVEMLADEEPALRPQLKATLQKIDPARAKKLGIR